MSLAEKLYYSISELSKHFDVAPSLLRYWESEFNSIKPRRNSKGTRFYTKKDVEEIAKIHLLVKEQGYTLQGAREQLKKNKSKIDSKSEVVAKLETVREMLIQIKNQL